LQLFDYTIYMRYVDYCVSGWPQQMILK